MKALGQFGNFLIERQGWVLIALLAVLHLTLLAGDGAAGMMFWLVDVGLFILWQPFIRAEKKLDYLMLLLIALSLVAGSVLFGWWLLMLWVVALAALLGGRVMLLAHWPTRVFYLLAFSYLLAALLVLLVPRVVPDKNLLGTSLDHLFVWTGALVFMAMALIPHPRDTRLVRSGVVDYFYSIFIFLLISVVVLGSLAFMLLRQLPYIEAVFKTLLTVACLLLVMAWAWNPRLGFSGLGVLFSRYLLSVGLPFEAWMQHLMETSAQEADPEKFLQVALKKILELPWVSGGMWADSANRSGRFGEASSCSHDFVYQPLRLTLHTTHQLSPSLIWHFHLLLQLTNEYYLAKRRAEELQQMSYLRAVHETGARLTHDVKNLLQSLNNLCFVAQSPDHADPAQLSQLLQRQLPQITQRLQHTLEKLQAPQIPALDGYLDSITGETEAWWTLLRQRYANDDISFTPVTFAGAVQIPVALFDRVADNLLHNALIKRQSDPALSISVTIAPDASLLRVVDTGRAVRPDISRDLLTAPVASENGLGIGLYHAALQAEGLGYQLCLASNEDGQVGFELRQLKKQ
ncbi:MAG: sensor histidine kinase [Betaproteobacteria bacterium]